MIYEICEVLRESLVEINDKMLFKIDEIEASHSIDNAFKSSVVNMDAPLTFTPVTKESFEQWCQMYLDRIHKEREEKKTERDLRPTGKQIFELNRKDYEVIELESVAIE